MISNEEKEENMKIAKSHRESGVSEAIENESKQQKDINMLLGTVGASLLGNLLSGREVKATRLGEGIIKASEEETAAISNAVSSFS